MGCGLGRLDEWVNNGYGLVNTGSELVQKNVKLLMQKVTTAQLRHAPSAAIAESQIQQRDRQSSETNVTSS
eukprot:jgi/Chrzof1/14990/Cz09g23120.t1